MARVSPIQNNFNGGEISPLLYGRPDVDRYKTGLKTCLNFLPLVQGPVERRPGTGHIVEVKTSSLATRIVRFEFSASQAYIIEFGNLYCRFIKDRAQIVSGTPVELVTTYLTADLFQLKFAQSADILYVVHPSYPPRKISRTSDTAWSITDITFSDGPFLNTNTTPTTLVLGGTTGTVSVTAANTTTTAITGATAANPVVITDTAHGYADGTVIQIKAVGGMVELNNNFYKVNNKTTNTFELTDLSDVDIDGTGFTSYTSGGTASRPMLGINNNTGFQSTDVGRKIRWKDAAGNWTFLTITVVTNVITVTAVIDGPDASATTLTVNWRLGVWSATTGYPGAITFHQNRLVFGGPTDNPQRVDMSRTGDFENFAPTEPDATVVDDNAVTDTLSADTVNSIRWLADDEKGLLVGTVGGEWIMRPSEQGGIVTPASVQSKRSSAYGSANIQPVRVGRAMVFIQRALRKTRELAYVFEDDGFRAPDLTLVAEHVTRTGVVDMVYQGEPQSIVWTVLTDGTLVSVTYDREQQVVGWARHVLGGVSDAGTTQAKVESVAVIPNTEGTADELYMVVNRYINGATVRHIEYLKPHWDGSTDQEDAFFVDSGLSLDTPLTITGITKADPAVVTIASHTFSDGDDIRITKVVGMTDVNKKTYIVGEQQTNTFELFSNTKQNTTITAITKANPCQVTAVGHGLVSTDEIGFFNVGGMTELNGNGYTVTKIDDDNFTIGVDSSGFTTFTAAGDIRHAVDSTAFTTYVSGGEARERVTAISNLTHLEGQTVQILAEGATHADKVVASGAITLDRPASKVHAGLAYVSDFETLRLDAGARDGTSQGKLNRIHRVILRVLNTLGGFIGPDADNLDQLTFREGGDPMDNAVPLFTGDIEVEWDGAYDSDNHIFYRQTQPLPVTIEAVMPQLELQDRA